MFITRIIFYSPATTQHIVASNVVFFTSLKFLGLICSAVPISAGGVGVYYVSTGKLPVFLTSSNTASTKANTLISQSAKDSDLNNKTQKSVELTNKLASALPPPH